MESIRLCCRCNSLRDNKLENDFSSNSWIRLSFNLIFCRLGRCLKVFLWWRGWVFCEEGVQYLFRRVVYPLFFWRVVFHFLWGFTDCIRGGQSPDYFYSNLLYPKNRFIRLLFCLPKVPKTFDFQFLLLTSQKSLSGRSSSSSSVSFFKHAADKVFFVILDFLLSRDFSSADTRATVGQGSLA